MLVSDTQAPLWVEGLWAATETPEWVTPRILSAIAGEERCAAVVHCGDITAVGSDEEAWGVLDAQAAPIRDVGLPIFPALGNHDYYFWSGAARASFAARFPGLSEIGYARRVGRVAILLVNSNASLLSPVQLSEQAAWYESELRRLDRDPEISLVIVAAHHSPYTNSTVVSPSEEVQERFVPPFLRSAKARLFASGHCHAFEHFQIAGKDFFVLGGGGGLPQALLLGDERRWPDLFPSATALRPFHYLRATPGDEGVRFEVVALSADGQSFAVIYEHLISWPPATEGGE